METAPAPRREPFKVWPENWLAVRLWSELWPRWRMLVGLGGAVRQGLDLAQVQAAFTLGKVPRKQRKRLYRDLLEMESEALEALGEK